MLVRRARIVAFLIFGLSGGADASQEGKDMKLEDMGFVMRAADTPERSSACSNCRRAHSSRAARTAAVIICTPIQIIANACSSATKQR